MSIAKQLLEELDKDEKLSNEFISRIAFKLAQNTDIRLLVLNSLIRDVATKMDIEGLGDAIGKDIQELRNETKAEIESLRNETKNQVQLLKGDMIKYVDSKYIDMIKYVDSKFDSFDKRMNDLNNRIDEVRYDMRTYFFGFLGGIVATLITIILTKFL